MRLGICDDAQDLEFALKNERKRLYQVWYIF